MEIFSFLSSILGLVVVGGILYLIFRPKEGQVSGKDAYFYVVSFVLLLLLTWAVTDLLRIFWEQMWSTVSYGGSVYSYQQTTLLKNVSLRLSVIVVAFPIWAFHWYKASKKKKEDVDYHSLGSYITAMLVISSLVAIGTITGLVYQGFNAILGIGESAKQSIPYLVPYAMASTILWVWHFGMWRKAKEAGK